MPRKKGKKKNAQEKTTSSAPKPTYHRSKNGRYYKKMTGPSGKTLCRFVSKKEAEDGGVGSS